MARWGSGELTRYFSFDDRRRPHSTFGFSEISVGTSETTTTSNDRPQTASTGTSNHMRIS